MNLNFQGGKPNAKQEMFIKNLVSAMEKRFPCTGLVEATMITSFLNWPEKGSESIPDSNRSISTTEKYGNGEVKMMANNFKFYLHCDDEEEVLQEWSLLKALIYEKKLHLARAEDWDIKEISQFNQHQLRRSVELEAEDHNLLVIENEGNEDDDHVAYGDREDESDSELSSDDEDLEMTEMEIERELENV